MKNKKIQEEHTFKDNLCMQCSDKGRVHVEKRQTKENLARAMKIAEEAQWVGEQGWEEEFDNKITEYEPKGWWLMAGMDGDLDTEKVKQFISQTIQSLIDSVREEERKQIAYDINAMMDLRPLISYQDISKTIKNYLKSLTQEDGKEV